MRRPAARADVKATVEHNTGEAATADFKFKTVPVPAKAGAAVKAKATLVDGDKDDAARDVSSLTDGAVPTEEDQPDNNFFFNAGTEGGRVEIDLGSAMPVKQVNTYSWHASTRGPQVYKMYAADGTGPGFNPAPKKGTDPTRAGGKLVTSVDTRPKDGEPGGQYGVSVADTAGAPLGTYRYICSTPSGPRPTTTSATRSSAASTSSRWPGRRPSRPSDRTDPREDGHGPDDPRSAAAGPVRQSAAVNTAMARAATATASLFGVDLTRRTTPAVAMAIHPAFGTLTGGLYG